MKHKWYSNLRKSLLLEADDSNDVDNSDKNLYNHIDLFEYFKKLYNKGDEYALLVTARKTNEPARTALVFDEKTNDQYGSIWDNEWTIGGVISNSTRIYFDIATISKDDLVNYIITDHAIQIVSRFYTDVDITIIKLHDMEEIDNTNINYDELDALLPINNEISLKDKILTYFNNIKNNEKLNCMAIKGSNNPVMADTCFKEYSIQYDGYSILNWKDEADIYPRISKMAGYNFFILGYGSRAIKFFKYEIVNPKSII